jgi:ABC-type multidrug transport system fused ATPase/permease subunit
MRLRLNVDNEYVKLWKHISKQRRKQLFGLIFLIIISSFAEVVSLGAVVPFLIILSNPDKIFYHPLFKELNLFFQLRDSTALILPITIFFIFTSLAAGLIRILLLKFTTILSYQTGADISRKIFRNTLYQDYLAHVQRNSNILVTGIISKANQIVNYTIQPILNFISSTTILLVIFFVMVSVDPLLILSSFMVLFILYLSFAVQAKKKLLLNSRILSLELNNLQKILSEGFGGIRDVILDHSQEVYLKKYINSDAPYRSALAENSFKTSSPKYYVEAFGLIAFAIFAYYLTISKGSMLESLPLLGALALSAQRMLPVIQILFNSWANLRTGKSILRDVVDLLELKTTDFNQFDVNRKEIQFQKSIRFESVSFSYPETDSITLRNITFEFEKGQRVGIVGKTGSGKSTLLDMIMGLIPPKEGKIIVDDFVIDDSFLLAWQKNISHVPQSIFLSDSSISQNVALGLHESHIDLDKVWKCLEQAELVDFVKSLKEGIHTFVGERGVKLSGGQRQRIGIARALYKEAKIIVFDEATSALDEETERQLMKSIYNLNQEITIIIVAHRLTTIRQCDLLIKLTNGEVEKVGNYDFVLGES